MENSRIGTVSFALGILLILSAIQLVTASSVNLSSVDALSADGEDILGGYWSIEVIDSDAPSDSDSIVIDGSDVPHVCYNVYDQGGYSHLRYANKTGGTWNVETLAWGGINRHCDITLDSNDNPQMAYYYQTETEEGMKITNWTDSGWQTDIVTNGNCRGQSPSIALDENDVPHIVFWDGSTHKIYYAVHVGDGWNISVIHPVGFIDHDNSMTVDSQGAPHVAYKADGYLHYAKLDGADWDIQRVDSKLATGEFVSIAIDSTDKPHIAYTEYSPDYDLRYANLTGANWEVTVLDTENRIMDSHIALDSNDHPHISYTDIVTDYIKYAEWADDTWNIETVVLKGHNGGQNLALDSNDKPYISFDDDINSMQKLATKSDVPWRYVSLEIYPDVLNLRCRQRWVTAYLTTVNATADQIAPESLLLNDVLEPAWWKIQNLTMLVAKFDWIAVIEILPKAGQIDMKVAGKWRNGDSFEAHDTIRVFDPGPMLGCDYIEYLNRPSNSFDSPDAFVPIEPMISYSRDINSPDRYDSKIPRYY